MAAVTHYDIGDVWVPQWTFTVGGTPTDPTNITVKVRNAAGTVTTMGPVAGGTGGAGIVRVSTGVFNTLVALDSSGYWYANAEGTGAAAASEQHEAIVDPSPFSTTPWGLNTRALVGLGETKDWLQANQIATGEDMDLVRVINDVSDRMCDEAEREFKVFGTNPQIRQFDLYPAGPSEPWYVDGIYLGEISPGRRTVKVGDLTLFSQVRILDQDWSTLVEDVTPLTKVAGLPLNRAPWQPIRALQLRFDTSALGSGQRLEVTGNWGFPQVPGNIRQATLDAIAAIMDRDVEHYRQDLGQVPASLGEGNTIVIGGGRQRMLSLPASSAAVAWQYRDINVG